MAEVQKAKGRPKKQPEKVVETAKNKMSSKELEPDVEIHPAKEKVSNLSEFGGIEDPSSEEVVKEKVIEVKTKQGKKSKLSFSERKNNSFDVIVKGKLRAMSRQAYEAVSKDPQLKVSLPKGSPLAANLEAKEKPCKDC